MIDDAERMAAILHGSLVNRVAKAQKRIIEHEAILKRFEDNVVPQSKLLQTRRSLKEGATQMREWIKRDEALIVEYVEAIRELEILFEQKEKADISEMVAAIKRWHKTPAKV